MSEQEHRERFESLGAYALRALPPSERAAVARHVDDCPICAEELAGLQQAAAALLESVPQVDPPAHLRRRIMDAVQPEAARPRRRAQRPSFGERFSLGWAVAGAALAVAGGVAGFALRDGTEALESRTLQAQAAGAQRAWLEVADGGEAQLVVEGLKNPPRDHVYEVWVQHGVEPPVPAGALFVVRSGRVDIPAQLEDGDRVMVSVEPQGGSKQPTTPPLIVTERL